MFDYTFYIYLKTIIYLINLNAYLNYIIINAANNLLIKIDILHLIKEKELYFILSYNPTFSGFIIIVIIIGLVIIIYILNLLIVINSFLLSLVMYIS